MSASSDFVEGQCYTRQQIHDLLGGDMQSFLPHKDGRIVCACLTSDLNQDAPSKVLVGDGLKVKGSAEILASQKEAVPVFLKTEAKRWEFVGLWSCSGTSVDAGEIKVEQQRSGRADISMILKLSKVR